MCQCPQQPAEALDPVGLETPFSDRHEGEVRRPDAGFLLGERAEAPFAETPLAERGDFLTSGENTVTFEAAGIRPDAGVFQPEQFEPAFKQDVSKAPDLKAAENVMYEIMRLFISGDAQASDPDRAKKPPPWYRLHTSIFKEWHLVVHGTATAKGRTRLQGEALGAKVESAFTLTKPVLDVLKKRGGSKWQKLLRQSFYAPVAKFELEAIQTTPPTPRTPPVPPITFALRPPQPVSLAQFFGFVSEWGSEPIPLQEKIGGIQIGSVKSGQVFSASQQDQRLVLWTGSPGVLFLRDGAIFAQSGAGFAHDIIYGAFVLGAQNAVGSMIMAQLMVELSLSFTPWGRVWDLVSAFKALTEKDWKGAALAALPGPALELAAKTRAFKAIARGAVMAAKFGKAIAQKGFQYIARGAYVLNGKMLRGFWLVGEESAAKVRTYRFLDEVTETVHDVPPAKAVDYIVCSRCRIPPAGERLARRAEVQDIMEDVIASASYASGRKLLIKPKLVEDVVAAYGMDGGDVVRNILDAFDGSKDAAKHANDCMELAKTLSKVKSRHPRFRNIAVYQDAIDIFADLAAHPNTARGAMFELEWAAKHVDEISSMGVPIYQKGWKGVGKGLDVMGKRGVAVELKNYNFALEIYQGDPERSVSRIVNQAKLRLAYKEPAVSEVRFVFDSRTKMPAAFKKMLDEEFAALTSSSGRSVSFQFWP